MKILTLCVLYLGNRMYTVYNACCITDIYLKEDVY